MYMYLGAFLCSQFPDSNLARGGVVGVARAGQYLPVSHSGQCRHLLAVAWKRERGGEGERREGDFIFNHAERSKEFPAHQSNVSGGHWTDPLPPQYIHCCTQTDLNANERLTKYNSIQNADYCTLDLLCVRVHVHACIHVVLTDRCWPARPHFPSLSH